MKLITVLLLLFTSIGFSQTIQVEVNGNIFNTNQDSVMVSQFYGTHYVDYLKGKLDKKGDFVLTGTLPFEDYYVIRIGTQHINLICKANSKIRVIADGKNINAFHNIVGSDESVALNEFVTQMQAYRAKMDTARVMIQRYPQNADAINQSFQQEYFGFNAYKQKFISQHENSPALIPVLSTLDTEKEFEIYEAIVNQLIIGFPNSPSVKNTKINFDQMKAQKEAANFLAPGKKAPVFVQNDVNGKPISLEDLKGKVVLIDFWASWCGPCRKENPNVVNLYKKYKDKGFTVLSVSLDNEKAKWLGAIEKDGLVWPYHVSDLKGWANEASKMYGVTGIPFTVLVDANGNIINTKLRGPELEQTLKSIFGF
ncbi:MAG: redoxin family protein [Fluviicola sp.]|jgi:thiol-disulfide isomerase/thioredoxin